MESAAEERKESARRLFTLLLINAGILVFLCVVGYFVFNLWLFGEKDVPTLVEYLRTGNKELRYLASLQLGAKKDPAALAPLMAALGDPAFEVRAAAARSLGILGDARCVAALVKAMADPDHMVRHNAALALGELKDPQAGATLMAGCADRSAEVRKACAWAIGAIRPPGARERLREILADTDPRVRAVAGEALWRQGDDSGAQALFDLLTANGEMLGERVTEEMQIHLIGILAEMKYAPAGEEIKRLAAEGHRKAVREAAEKALEAMGR